MNGPRMWLCIALLFLSPALASGEWTECGYPEDEEDRHNWIEIDLDDLFEGIWSPEVREELDADINLFVEDTLIWLYSDGLLDSAHLATFIDEIWHPDGDDIREIWDYFASGPTRPVYGEWGDPPGSADYNFRYPWGATDVNIRLRDHSYSTGGGNTVKINIMCSAGYIPDDWPEGSRSPWTFCHEFQHTIGSYFDSEFGYFEEAFAEAAPSVAGRPRINVNVPHSDNSWFRYDLAFNNGIPRHWYSDQSYQCQSTQTCSKYYYWVWNMWMAYVYEQFPGDDPNSMEDDFLYQALRAEDNGTLLRGLYAFYKTAENYTAWGYENSSDLYRAMFDSWTIANLLDGTDFDARYEYTGNNIRIRAEDEAGIGWLRDNEGPFCNNNPDPSGDPGCGDWVPPEVELDQLGVTEYFNRDEPGYDGVQVGVEIYAADYVKFTPDLPSPPPGVSHTLSLAFDVHDEDQYDDSDNIIMHANVVGYSIDEDHPIFVDPVDMGQSQTPTYNETIYHAVDEFGSATSFVHTIVNAMEDDVIFGKLVNGSRVPCHYPMRSYTISAIVVQKEIDVMGTLTQDVRWYHGQIVNVTGNLCIDPGVTLAIEPGVTVKVAAAKQITVKGTLDAVGNSIYPIVFTSSSQNPAPGDWKGVFTNVSPGTGLLKMEHCRVEFAEEGVRAATSYPHSIKYNTFSHCLEKGLRLYQCTTADPIVGNSFEYNGLGGEPGMGVYMDHESEASFLSNSFVGNSYGLYAYQADLADCIGNSFSDNVTGMYIEEGAVLNSDGFRELYFGDNQYGLYMVKPQGATTYLKNSTFEGHSDCAIYYNKQQNGSDDFSMQDLTIIGGTSSSRAGIRTQGMYTEPLLRHCEIRDFVGGSRVPLWGEFMRVTTETLA